MMAPTARGVILLLLAYFPRIEGCFSRKNLAQPQREDKFWSELPRD